MEKLRKDLLTTTEILKILKEDGITTSVGTEINRETFKKMVSSGKIPHYKVPKKKLLYFVLDEVMDVFVPTKHIADDEEDEFKKMIIEAESVGMQFSQYVKAKEVYETYVSKNLDNAIKRREHIPLHEIKSVMEVIVGELKSKMYNIPTKVKSHFHKLDNEVTDYMRESIDSAFSQLYYKSNKLEEDLQ